MVSVFRSGYASECIETFLPDINDLIGMKLLMRKSKASVSNVPVLDRYIWLCLLKYKEEACWENPHKSMWV